MEMLESPLSLEPRYRINAVSDMTGLSAPNLRAWERRYGIPNPQRADNAYRLYSNRDVMILRKMKSLCDAGHAPSDAAKIALTEIESQKSLDFTPVGFVETREMLIKATEEFNPARVEQILTQSLTLGSAWDIYYHIFEPALVHIGDLWENDPKYVAHEHMLAQAIKGSLSQLLKVIQPPNPRITILFACIAHEQHDMPLYALSILASHSGCLPIILGANTPPEAIKSAIGGLKPQGVILSTTTTLIVSNHTDVMTNRSKRALETQENGSNNKERDTSKTGDKEKGDKEKGNKVTLIDEVTSGPLDGFPFEQNTLSVTELSRHLKAYQEACGETPWLIGGRAIETWPQMNTALSPHIASSYRDLDLLTR